jgi:hypothetical protein
MRGIRISPINYSSLKDLHIKPIDSTYFKGQNKKAIKNILFVLNTLIITNKDSFKIFVLKVLFIIISQLAIKRCAAFNCLRYTQNN